MKPAPENMTRFIEYVIKICGKDKDNNKDEKKYRGLAARLRRADNPSTEYQSWEILAAFGIEVDNERHYQPSATLAAAIAKARGIERNGDLGLGHAIAACYPEGSKNDQSKARLRRLLACKDLTELCRHLRPLFSLIDSRVEQRLDYLRLLDQLYGFAFDSRRIKLQWVQDFHRQTPPQEAGEATA